MTVFFGWHVPGDFLSWTRPHQDLFKILWEHVSPVMKEGKGYCVVLSAKHGTTYGQSAIRLLGLTKLMDLCMIGSDREVAKIRKRRRKAFRRAHPKGGGGRTVAEKRSLAATPVSAEPSPYDHLTGAEVGVLVHRQVMEAVACASIGDFKQMPGNKLGMHGYVPRIVALLMARGIRPFAAEYRTYNLELRCATQIDLIGLTGDGDIVFIELKTGYSKGAWRKQADDEIWTLPCLPNNNDLFPCTPLTKAMVQLILGAEMCIREHHLDRNRVRYLILRIDPWGSNVVHLDVNIAYAMAMAMIQDLLDVGVARRT